jgi:hypothetical protein
MSTSSYIRSVDGPRLKGQHDRVMAVMKDGQWRTYWEIGAEIQKRFAHHDSQTGIAARMRELRRPKFGSNTVECRAREGANRGVFEYRLIERVDPVTYEQKEMF